MKKFVLRSQQGSTHLLLPLALLVIVGVSFAGYRVYRNASAATAPTPGSLYSYDFRGASLTSPVSNGAAVNTAVGLNLVGSWSKTDFGIHFAGGTTSGSGQSVSYAKPASGNVISVPATQSLGGSIMFKYEGPSPGTGCVGDSRNLTQIGRFAAGAAQFKIQYSNCGTNKTSVFPECRIAGSKSSSSVVIARSSQALVNGETYIIQCAKSPDTSTNTTVQLKVVRVDTTNGNQVSNDTNIIPAAGAMTTTAALSIGNKYPLPSQTNNTDQFVGDVAKVAYCSGLTLDAVTTCLNTEIPEPVPTQPVVVTDPADPRTTPDTPTVTPDPEPTPAPSPTTQEFVTNQSFETGLTGWTSLETSVSQNSQASGGYDGSYSLRSVNNSSVTGKHGFISKPSWLDGTTGKATVAGKNYNATAWVKPDAVGQKLSIYLREMNASGATVSSKTATITAGSTNWQQITNAYAAVGSGNSLQFHVFSTNTSPHGGFNTDLIRLSTTN